MTDRITVNREICHGRPVITGTRTPVSVILGHIAGGDTCDSVRTEYGITDQDIRAAIAFANDELGRITFIPAPVGGA